MTTAPAHPYAKAIELENAERALQDAEQRFGKESPQLNGALEQLCRLYHRDGLYAKAELLSRQQVAILAQSDDKQKLSSAMSRLAQLCRAQGKLEEAESVYLKALTIAEQNKDNKVAYAQNLCALSGVYLSKGELGQSEGLLKKAASVYADAFGASNGYSRLCNAALSLVCHKQGKKGEADGYFEQSRLEKGADGKAESQSDLRALLELVQGYYAQGRMADVETLLQESLLGQEEEYWPDDPCVASIWQNRGELFRAQGRFTDAESCFKQALELRRKVLDNAHPEVAITAMSLATMYLSQNRCAEAEPALKCALQVRVRAFGVENPAVAACIETYVALLKRTKRGAIASKLEARARDIRTYLVAQAERKSSAVRPEK
jgi:tetratricopeptide (TPR) repeat protein